MTVLHCVMCDGRNFSLVARTSYEAPRGHPSNQDRVYAAFSCDNNDCHFVLGGTTYANPRSGDEISDHWPVVPIGKAFPHVPVEIASAADEAHRCSSIGAGRGAIGLARSVIEAVAKQHGITNGTIEAKIDEMASQQVIGTDTKDAAHAIRQWGNDAMHGELAPIEFDEQDAQDVLQLMDDVLARAYQVRARTADIVARRQAKRAGSSTPTP